MIKVKIYVTSVRNEELGIEEEGPNFSFLKFRPEKLGAYWLSTDDDNTPDVIVFYVESHKFETPYDINTITMFDDILSK